VDFQGPGLTARLFAAEGQAERTSLERKARQAGMTGKEREGLEKAAQEFEAVFLNTLMKAMRKTVPENDLFNGGGATKFYRQMHDVEMAKALATANGGLGIADMIVRQLDRGDEEQQPLIGPASPAPLRGRVLDSAPSRIITLRRLAENQGTAAADTLRRHEPEIHQAARRNGLDPALVLAVVLEESGGDAGAVSPRGAQGLMQLMPATAREVGVEDAFDPAQNLRGGTRYLARMVDDHDGNLGLALAAYNAGPGAVAKAGNRIPDYPETRNYVARVLDRFRQLGGGTQMAKENR